MYANSSKLLGGAIVATAAIVTFSILFMVQFGLPLAFAANQIAPNVILTVNVPTVCEVSLSPTTLNFGTVIPSQNTIYTNQNVIDTNNGNGGATIWVYGGNWIGANTALTFGVANTTWATSNTAYGSGHALTQISTSTGVSATPQAPGTVWWGLGIPAGQTANVYSQNIIITNVC